MTDYHGMTDWETIACQNPEPHEHETFMVEVDLSERHGYLNYAPIPERLWLPPFEMEIWNWEKATPASQPVEGEWCPARCAISQTIAEQGIWEPPETLTLLNLFEGTRYSDDEQWEFIDVGAQLGWFSILAARCGLIPVCWEADWEVADILRRNLERFAEFYEVREERIGRDSTGFFGLSPHPAIMKIDIEGAEPDAIKLHHASFESGRIKAVLIETTPHFGVDVHAMADQLINEYGFTARILPPKVDPYVPYDQIDDLAFTSSPKMVEELAIQYRQINVLYLQPGFPTIV